MCGGGGGDTRKEKNTKKPKEIIIKTNSEKLRMQATVQTSVINHRLADTLGCERDIPTVSAAQGRYSACSFIIIFWRKKKYLKKKYAHTWGIRFVFHLNAPPHGPLFVSPSHRYDYNNNFCTLRRRCCGYPTFAIYWQFAPPIV